MNELQARTTAVSQRIIQAAEKAKRPADNITLIAVTKTWPVETLFDAYEAGLRHFGENRTDELEAKRQAFDAKYGADNGVTWHFIGNLQSRKAKSVADFADTFHAVERLKIVNKLQDRLGENGRILHTFIEVNVSGEMSKSGVNCTNWEQDATQQDGLRTVAQAILDAPNLQLVGLMTMAPWHAPEDEVRAVFARTEQLSSWLREDLGRERPFQLSMGMTDDFEIATAAGATHVRVGRAIFGKRQK